VDVEERKGLEEQIRLDTERIDRLLSDLDRLDSGNLMAVARLEDHIAYCKKKLAE
jgi:hypothetical protein